MITEMFDVVQVNGEDYVIADKYVAPAKYPAVVLEKLTTGKWSLWQIDNPNDVDVKTQKNILATTNKSLGFPYLQSTTEYELIELRHKFGSKLGDLHPNDKDKLFEIVCEVFGVTTKKYGEEDMKKAFIEGWDIVNQAWKNRKTTRYEVPNAAHLFKEFMQSLKRKPKQVEVEMEERNVFVETQDSDDSIYTTIEEPKVVNNIIQVKRWIF